MPDLAGLWEYSCSNFHKPNSANSHTAYLDCCDGDRRGNPTAGPNPTSNPDPGANEDQHVTKPGEPVYIVEQDNTDCTLGKTTGSNLAVVIPPACDNQLLNFIERPVTLDTKTYLPYLDIGKTHFGGNINWMFARMDIYDAVAPTGVGDLYYFFKLISMTMAGTAM